MIDSDGYRPNVAIVLCNSDDKVFLGKRLKEDAWQFPQGGIDGGETPEQAMYRELGEEVGLDRGHVELIGRTRGWLKYDVPSRWLKTNKKRNYRGQKQIWFLLRMIGSDSDVSLQRTSYPEFDAWKWGEYWVPLNSIIKFKRKVYRDALVELSTYLGSSRITEKTTIYGYDIQ